MGNISQAFNDAAAARDWGFAMRILIDNPDFRTPWSAETDAVFRRAADDGQSGFVEELFRRGFSFPSKVEGEEIIERLARNGGDGALRIVSFLIKEKHADPGQAVLNVAKDGTVDTMKKLKDAGADISGGNDSFSTALYAGNLAMMRFLFNQGVNIYRPSVVAGLHGRRDNFRDRFGGPETPVVAAFYKDLVKDDERALALYCAYVCPPKPMVNDLRGVPYGLLDKDTTLMQLLARVGEAEEIIKAALRDDKDRVTLEDLLRQDRDGASVLSIMAARGEEKKLLDARLWLHNPSLVNDVNEALKDMRAGQQIDRERFEQDLRYARLKKKADPKRWSLGPKHL